MTQIVLPVHLHLQPEPNSVPAGLACLFPAAKWALDRSVFLLLSRLLTPSSSNHGSGRLDSAKLGKKKHGLSKKMAEALWKVRHINV